MKLNIYEKKKIIKTYEVDTYDLMFGTIEDVANAVDLDSLEGVTTGAAADIAIVKMVGKLILTSMDTVKDLLKDIFEGITDEELKKTKVSELANVFIEVVKYTIAQLSLGGNGKN